MRPYIPLNVSGREALDHIMKVTDCSEQQAWEQFRDAAADAQLRVRMLDFNCSPSEINVGRWKRAARDGDLYIMTDWGRFEVARAELETLWPKQRQPTRARKPEQPRVNQALLDFAKERGIKLKQSDIEARAHLIQLGARDQQRIEAFRNLPPKFKYGRGKPPSIALK